jgi:hypothetical protein
VFCFLLKINEYQNRRNNGQGEEVNATVGKTCPRNSVTESCKMVRGTEGEYSPSSRPPHGVRIALQTRGEQPIETGPALGA